MTYKEDMKFQNNCLYETGKVAVSARVINSGVRWLRVFHESIHVLRKKNLEIKFRGNFSQHFSLYWMHRTFLEDMFNCFQLTTLAIMTLFLDSSLLEILSQNAALAMCSLKVSCSSNIIPSKFT